MAPKSDKTPFHPAFGVTSIKNHVAIVLEMDNVHYDVWAELFLNAAKAFDIYEHLVPPAKPTEQPEGADKALWDRLDAIVKQWIYATISSDILLTIVESGSSAQATWERIHSLFNEECFCKGQINMADKGFEAFVRDKFQSMTDLSAQPCIYKAPDHLREVNEECYRPYVVSIGPLYYGLPSLKAMEDYKLRFLKFFLEHEMNSYKFDLKRFLRIVADMEGHVRHCYTEQITFTSDKFNGMILVDSAFLICLFMKRNPILGSSMVGVVDIYKRNIITWGAILTRDLFLLENQVPFFVLERLFREAFGATLPNTSFRELALGYIVNAKIPIVQTSHICAATIERVINATEIAHLVDLLRNLCLTCRPGQQVIDPAGETNVQFPSVSNLTAAGVKVVVSESTHLLHITFSGGVLKIPRILLDNVSESYYRSLILFEQSHLPIHLNSYIIDYLLFLQMLIRDPADVRILAQCGIIDNFSGSQDVVVRHFNTITKYLTFPSDFCYIDVCRDLDVYAKTLRCRWNKWKAILKNEYFSHPWAAISVIYALVLLILTFVQTVGTFTNK